MRAAVLEGHRGSVFGPKQNDRVAQDHATQWFAADLRIGRGDVPIISQEHGRVLHAACAAFFGFLCGDYNPIQNGRASIVGFLDRKRECGKMTGNECKDIPSLKIVSTLVLAEQRRGSADRTG